MGQKCYVLLHLMVDGTGEAILRVWKTYFYFVLTNDSAIFRVVESLNKVCEYYCFVLMIFTPCCYGFNCLLGKLMIHKVMTLESQKDLRIFLF